MLPVNRYFLPMPWSAKLCEIPRMTANLSAHFASIGRCSQIRTPAALVSIGLNSPRTSAGASGLRSNVSWCDGPPSMKTNIPERFSFLASPLLSPAAANRTKCESPNPAPSAPTLSISRREKRGFMENILVVKDEFFGVHHDPKQIRNSLGLRLRRFEVLQGTANFCRIRRTADRS